MRALRALSALLLVSGVAGPAHAQIHRFDGVVPFERFGTAVACCDLNRDSYGDTIVGTPDASAPWLYSGRVTVFSGRDGTVLREFTPPADTNRFGFSVACGYVNADLYPDLIIGAPDATPGGLSNAGSVFVYSGRDGSLIRRIDGTESGEYLGWSVAAGRIDADLRQDVIAGAPGASPGGVSGAGSVFAFSAVTGAQLLRRDGLAALDNLGWSVAAGDVNADGRDDIITGAPLANPGGLPEAGEVCVYSGAGGALLLRRGGATPGDNLGLSVAAGDVNGDGYQDVIGGAPGAEVAGIGDSVGSVWVYSGRTGATLRRLDGAFGGQQFGHSVASCYLTPDPWADVIVGAPANFAPVPVAGSVLVYSGHTGGLRQRFSSGEVGDSFGYSVACGYVDDDFFADLVIGAPDARPGGVDHAGSAFDFSGRPGRGHP